MSLEYECKNCKIRLDPLMTKDEADYFLKMGCPMCHHNAWQIVEGIYDKWIKEANPIILIEEEKEELHD
jgi:Zn finger protein HypA/HybF involved in hydrogenase expression